MRAADVASGFLLIVLGLMAVLGSPRAGPVTGGLGPGTVPAWTGGALACAGAVLALAARRYGPGTTASWPGRSGSRRVLVVVLVTAAYFGSLEPLGFPVASLGYVAFMVWYLGGRRALPALAWGIVAAAGIWLFAVRLLGLPFPQGAWPGTG